MDNKERKNLQFNLKDPRHVKALEILNSAGKGHMTQLVVDALLVLAGQEVAQGNYESLRISKLNVHAIATKMKAPSQTNHQPEQQPKSATEGFDPLDALEGFI